MEKRKNKVRCLKTLSLTLVFVFVAKIVFSQTDDKETAYRKTIQDRAAKIVQPLALRDSVKYRKVHEVIVSQYYNLRKIHDNQKVDSLKKEPLKALHYQFLTSLSLHLDSLQIVTIKDGMTYGVMPKTYNAYIEMLPMLNEKQKKQIFDYLVEARELAMDGESSDKKHAIFGKYKGRINNYISKEGIDSQKARKEWEEKLKN